MDNDFIVFKKAAFLLGISRENFESLAHYNNLDIKRINGTWSINISALKTHVFDKINRFSIALSYFNANDKKIFWEETNRKFPKMTEVEKDFNFEYLTITHVGYLLNMKAGSVSLLLFKGYFKDVLPIQQPKSVAYFVPASEVQRYVTEQIGKYDKILKYFDCDDPDLFWIENKEDFEAWDKKESEKRKNYGKTKKIQKSDSRKNKS